MAKYALVIFSIFILSLAGNTYGQDEDTKNSRDTVVVAKIISFRLMGGESISDNEVSSFFGPSVTKVRIVSPDKYKGKKLILIHSTTPSADSVFRIRGKEITFSICENDLTERSVPVEKIFLEDTNTK